MKLQTPHKQQRNKIRKHRSRNNRRKPYTTTHLTKQQSHTELWILSDVLRAYYLHAFKKNPFQYAWSFFLSLFINSRYTVYHTHSNTPYTRINLYPPNAHDDCDDQSIRAIKKNFGRINMGDDNCMWLKRRATKKKHNIWTLNARDETNKKLLYWAKVKQLPTSMIFFANFYSYFCWRSFLVWGFLLRIEETIIFLSFFGEEIKNLKLLKKKNLKLNSNIGFPF